MDKAFLPSVKQNANKHSIFMWLVILSHNASLMEVTVQDSAMGLQATAYVSIQTLVWPSLNPLDLQEILASCLAKWALAE